jgi:hypothetical protein
MWDSLLKTCVVLDIERRSKGSKGREEKAVALAFEK